MKFRLAARKYASATFFTHSGEFQSPAIYIREKRSNKACWLSQLNYPSILGVAGSFFFFKVESFNRTGESIGFRKVGWRWLWPESEARQRWSRNVDAKRVLSSPNWMAFYLAQFPALWIAAIYLNYVIHRTQPTAAATHHGSIAWWWPYRSMIVVVVACVSGGGGGQLMTRVCATAAVQLAPQCNFAL